MSETLDHFYSCNNLPCLNCASPFIKHLFLYLFYFFIYWVYWGKLLCRFPNLSVCDFLNPQKDPGIWSGITEKPSGTDALTAEYEEKEMKEKRGEKICNYKAWESMETGKKMFRWRVSVNWHFYRNHALSVRTLNIEVLKKKCYFYSF